MSERAERIRTVSALGIVQILCWGSSFYLLAVLAAPIAAQEGWPLAGVFTAFSISLVASGLAAPFVGRLIARHGGRRVMAIAVTALAAGLVAAGLAPSLPFFLAIWILLGLAMSGCLYDAAFSTLAQIFGAASRAPITTLTLWGGFASTVCWPLSAFLLETTGWRGACFVYAALHLAISLPLVLTLPRTKTAGGTTQPGVAHAAAELSVPRLPFALIAVTGMTGGAIGSIVSVHLITLLQTRGLTVAEAVAAGMVIGPAQVAARVVEMAAGGRYHPVFTLAAATALVLAGMTLLWSGLVFPGAALAVMGAGNGIWSIARGTVPMALFGPARYPVVMGRLSLPGQLMAAAAPFAASLALGPLGADAVLLGVVLTGCIGFGAAALLATLPRPGPP